MTLADVSALGEALLRLSVRPGERLEDAPAFDAGDMGVVEERARSLVRAHLARQSS